MRELNFTGYWEGDVEYSCDNCHKSELIAFENEDAAKDYKGQKKIMTQDFGWIFTKVEDVWHDFCCEKCKNAYIRKNTN